ncbi:MAG: Alpha-N-arabinofuranosidase, partial [Acidobacteria bacterium]|nr:Alpha-N-arabinofuranosidase [Acidobacteriota bacterium]
EAAKAMKSVDDSIKFVASGSSYYESTGGWVEWNRKVLAALFPEGGEERWCVC